MLRRQRFYTHPHILELFQWHTLTPLQGKLASETSGPLADGMLRLKKEVPGSPLAWSECVVLSGMEFVAIFLAGLAILSYILCLKYCYIFGSEGPKHSLWDCCSCKGLGAYPRVFLLVQHTNLEFLKQCKYVLCVLLPDACLLLASPHH